MTDLLQLTRSQTDRLYAELSERLLRERSERLLSQALKDKQEIHDTKIIPPRIRVDPEHLSKQSSN